MAFFHDLFVTIIAGILLAGVLLRSLDYLSKINVLSSFAALWPFYSNDETAPWLAAILPAAIGGKFLLIGLGLVKVSRTGNYKEVLYGPTSYGIIHVLCTIAYWRRSHIGIHSLLILCIGDGVAGLFGRQTKQRLPWNHEKTVGGTLAFFICSFMGFIRHSASELMFSMFFNALACSIVESLPYQQDLDNITTVLTSLFLSHWLTPH
ncbi:hypothetical protein PROFUN_08465 [Planoprotostelium fungivorum]|uniref:Dolichol kinase n=1 Tax=Planoprotostelium fungivorum TaxID=1890364 RepID=A0A2P6N1X1_9EUKA|nr:hypothetical protein PROFUN_08465 [Planoprotostelium fungivorum]